jgi:hypothetical protein
MLTGRQARAIEALCSEPSTAEAARTSEVSGRTLRRWLREDRTF